MAILINILIDKVSEKPERIMKIQEYSKKIRLVHELNTGSKSRIELFNTQAQKRVYLLLAAKIKRNQVQAYSNDVFVCRQGRIYDSVITICEIPYFGFNGS